VRQEIGKKEFKEGLATAGLLELGFSVNAFGFSGEV